MSSTGNVARKASAWDRYIEVRRATDLPLGIQVLAGANEAALAVAYSSGASFVRVEGFVFAHVADEGLAVHRVHHRARNERCFARIA